MENGKIVLMTRSQAIDYVREKMVAYRVGDGLLSEELISERREPSAS
ncbi:hypothetical protein [Cohnella caldifontis]|nr:hypothetical protein [Cohnella sp. YIM B05605]